MDGITLRRARPEDMNAVMALVTATVQAMQAAGIDQWDDVYPDRARFELDLSQGALHIAVDRKSGAIVGSVTLNSEQEPEYAEVKWRLASDAVAVIHRLMVAPAHWRGGLGRRLTTYAEDLARADGRTHLRLDTFGGNAPAQRLYEALGYTFAGWVQFRKGDFVCLEKRLTNDAAD